MTERTLAWTTPPAEIDGADVLFSVILREHIRPKAAAICLSPESHGVSLFYCNERWEVVADTMHETVAAAIEALARRHPGARDRLQRRD